MSFFQEGLRFELLDDIKSAIKCYNHSIESGENISGSFLNLSIIYWYITFDFGVYSYYEKKGVVSEHNIVEYGKKAMEILDHGLDKFPDNPEFIFWKVHLEEELNYIEYSSNDIMLNLLIRYPNFNLPYLYLILSQCKPVDRVFLNNFRIECAKLPAIKNKYIIELIDSL
ncbi:hypothetical protein [Hymenobacter latericus]|uniref:hypothetical protein n=1 Tax=Hymenobacter sp. YIM 151858-1 TaxID=2987688 RepID=UPI002226AB0E|nr:hypothetical protein [Hymenobacter sp. YIM 151858-1]UYZ59359.1 hypothetical protein OIS50_00830 [Hymenobacter sp. YIM 151858-1]